MRLEIIVDVFSGGKKTTQGGKWQFKLWYEIKFAPPEIPCHATLHLKAQNRVISISLIQKLVLLDNYSQKLSFLAYEQIQILFEGGEGTFFGHQGGGCKPIFWGRK